MLEIFQYSFMQRALIAALIIGIVSPLIGTFIVFRRLSFIGDTLSHTALAGVAIGIIVGINPIFGGMIFAVFSALAINKLREEYKHYEELSMPIMMSAGMGLAVVLISFSGGFTINISTYLFGSIIAVTMTDLLTIVVMGIVIIITVSLLYKELLYISFDEEGAKISGIPYKKLNLVFMILIALTIATSMRIVGILLISSMMILPVATSLQISKSFKQAIFLSILFAEIATVVGFFAAYYFDLASGGTIVLVSVFLLLFIIVFKKVRFN
ncbi:MAG: metal ABC transporter permease [Vulcanibacillus sp.]